MALADYRLCDVCGGKCFYDANLNYEFEVDEFNAHRVPYRLAGQPQYDKPELNHKHGARLDYVGDWAVICSDCAETHETKIVPRATASKAADSAAEK